MTIAVTAQGQDLDAGVDPRFGRCAFFLLVDSDSMQVEALPNPNTALGGGAGVQSAQLIADKDAEVVLTGNCGPNAFRTLDAAGVEVITGVSGNVREAVEAFKAGKLTKTSDANVQSHFGVGMGQGGGGRGQGGGGRGQGGGGRGQGGGGRGQGGGGRGQGGGGRGQGGGGRGQGGGGRG